MMTTEKWECDFCGREMMTNGPETHLMIYADATLFLLNPPGDSLTPFVVTRNRPDSAPGFEMCAQCIRRVTLPFVDAEAVQRLVTDVEVEQADEAPKRPVF